MDALLICRTCPRDQPTSGDPSIWLARDLSRCCEQLGVALLRVHCLGACRQPCSIALDSPTKPRLRFSGLGQDTERASLIALIAAYAQSTTGDPASLEIPDELRAALSAVSPKPRPFTESPHPSGAVRLLPQINLTGTRPT